MTHRFQNIRKKPVLELIFTGSNLILWITVYALTYYKNRVFDQVIWEKVIPEWIMVTALMLLFFVNIYILVPKLLFLKKYMAYTAAALLTAIIITGCGMLLQNSFTERNPAPMPPMEIGPGLPPMELSQSMPAPMGYKISGETIQKLPWLIFAEQLFTGILILIAGSTLKILSRWLHEEERRKEIEKIQLETELALLRHQVNPHFLMNTLNNIHALIDYDVEKSKDSLIRLSTLMRYLLYDSSKGKTNLQKEIEFIESYVALMKLRYSEKVDITIKIPEQIPDTKIPPLLFISFIENAFKHGVSYRNKSFVYFDLSTNQKTVDCIIRNSKHRITTSDKKNYSGIGMSNVKRSLELLYHNDYSLEINESETEYEVRLTVPLENSSYKKRYQNED
ncbi:MAG: histidine kinase [Paludibacter sp.]|nr:histidine kinase [Paludibacter sp.]